MACLDNLIGIKSCTTSTGSSPYFIEDIGITSVEADQYINQAYASGVALIQDKISFATNQVKDLIANHFSSSIITKSLVDSQLLGQYQDSLNWKSGETNTLGGISLTLNNELSYFKVFVNSVSLQVDVTQSIDVYVYDLISGTILDTIQVDCTANVVSTTHINKTYTSSKRKLDIIFVYDTTGINSNFTNLNYSDCNSCNGYRYSNYYINSSPIYLSTSAQKIRSSLSTTSHTYGMSINYSVQCSMDNWLCEIANLMALPILYKTGMEIMEYAVYYSNRQTSTINIDAERNRERLSLYSTRYNEALQATIQKISLPKYDQCFVCNESIKLAIVLP